MHHRLPLKNANRYALVDLNVYRKLTEDRHLRQINFFENLRLHSSGCVVFQKTYRDQSEKSGYRTETIYLHRLIAERFLSEQRTPTARFVGCHNGNKCDCRLENLEFRDRSTVSRKRRSSSRLGYTGVYQENSRYRAVISVNGKSLHLGMFSTPEEAALAYNIKSRELFGTRGKQNVIQPNSASAIRK